VPGPGGRVTSVRPATSLTSFHFSTNISIK
jgi:hypothetical protein